MIIIKIDNRERDLINIVTQLLSTQQQPSIIKLEIDTLPLGDIIISTELGKEFLIIERKTIADLRSSIKDGRYNEQSYRLEGYQIHNHNIIYLIEGNNIHILPDKNTIYSAMFSLNYFKGFSLWRTSNIQETAEVIYNTAKYLHKTDKTVYYSLDKAVEVNNGTTETITSNEDECKNDGEGNDKKYVNAIKIVKKDNITPENIGEIILAQIPSISCVTSIAIMKKFKCLTNLIADLQEHGIKCLEDIEIVNPKGGSRKISKKCCSNIVKYLLNE